MVTFIKEKLQVMKNCEKGKVNVKGGVAVKHLDLKSHTCFLTGPLIR